MTDINNLPNTNLGRIEDPSFVAKANELARQYGLPQIDPAADDFRRFTQNQDDFVAHIGSMTPEQLEDSVARVTEANLVPKTVEHLSYHLAAANLFLAALADQAPADWLEMVVSLDPAQAWGMVWAYLKEQEHIRHELERQVAELKKALAEPLS